MYKYLKKYQEDYKTTTTTKSKAYKAVPSMAIWVVEFSNGGYKIRKILRINIPIGNY